MGRFRSSLLILVAAIGSARADPAWAAGGVIEINQAAVLAGAVTPGDAPGFPAILNEAGSYVLTSNLTVPATVDGIRVNVSNVAIDLAGFTIVGPGTLPAGTGIVASPQVTNVRIREGSVRGMELGVFVGQDSRVEGLHALGNLLDGITLGARSIATRNTAVGNGRQGILLTATSAIAKDNVTHDNAGDTLTTWLLFPFVSNRAGFDTGLSISNTTDDPSGLGTTNRSGTCTLTPFGISAPAAFTTPTIAAGATWQTNASISMPGFQGYVIARCAFPLAHGYGFFHDQNVAASTPALVIQPGRVQNLPEGLGQ